MGMSFDLYELTDAFYYSHYERKFLGLIPDC